MNQSDKSKPKVCIGLPVYNGEKFIVKRLNSLLSQTFSDFELIISDNASTDSTSSICQEYARKDKRIRYIRQEKNMGNSWNFYFVLQEAKSEYFMWTAVDDILLPEFLEKNIQVLEAKPNVACSTSRMKMYGKMTDYLGLDVNDSLFTRLKKKIINSFAYMDTYPASGSYEDRINTFLKKCNHNIAFYGIFRTDQFKKSVLAESFLGNDTAAVLNILKYGEIYVVDEVLMLVYDGGMSRSGMIDLAKHMNKNLIGIIFPFLPFTRWFAKNIGINLLLKNIGFFVRLNCIGEMSLLIDLIRQFSRIISGNRLF